MARCTLCLYCMILIVCGAVHWDEPLKNFKLVGIFIKSNLMHAWETVNLYAAGVLWIINLTCHGVSFAMYKQTCAKDGQYVWCYFTILFHSLLKIGECHIPWQWMLVIQTLVSQENPDGFSRHYFCGKKPLIRGENAVTWYKLSTWGWKKKKSNKNKKKKQKKNVLEWLQSIRIEVMDIKRLFN